MAALGKFKAADAASNTLLSLAPDSAASHRVRGLLLLHMCQYDQAIEHLAEAMRLDPTAHECRRSFIRGLWARQLSYRAVLRVLRAMRSLPVFLSVIIVLVALGAFLCSCLYTSNVAEHRANETDMSGLAMFAVAALPIFGFRYVRALLDALAWLDPLGRQVVSPRRAKQASLIVMGSLAFFSAMFALVLAQHGAWRATCLSGAACAGLWLITIVEFTIFSRRARRR
jgi:tetratricopeptide (TPR) repeat protein